MKVWLFIKSYISDLLRMAFPRTGDFSDGTVAVTLIIIVIITIVAWYNAITK